MSSQTDSRGLYNIFTRVALTLLITFTFLIMPVANNYKQAHAIAPAVAASAAMALGTIAGTLGIISTNTATSDDFQASNGLLLDGLLDYFQDSSVVTSGWLVEALANSVEGEQIKLSALASVMPYIMTYLKSLELPTSTTNILTSFGSLYKFTDLGFCADINMSTSYPTSYNELYGNDSNWLYYTNLNNARFLLSYQVGTEIYTYFYNSSFTNSLPLSLNYDNTTSSLLIPSLSVSNYSIVRMVYNTSTESVGVSSGVLSSTSSVISDLTVSTALSNVSVKLNDTLLAFYDSFNWIQPDSSTLTPESNDDELFAILAESPMSLIISGHNPTITSDTGYIDVLQPTTSELNSGLTYEDVLNMSNAQIDATQALNQTATDTLGAINNLWDWLSDSLTVGLPAAIANAFGSSISFLGSILAAIQSAITGLITSVADITAVMTQNFLELPTTIATTVTTTVTLLFIPTDGFISDKSNVLSNSLNGLFGINSLDFLNAIGAEKIPQPVYIDISFFGTHYHLKVFDPSPLIQSIDDLQKYIRAFIALLLTFFVARNLLSLLKITGVIKDNAPVPDRGAE